MESRFHVYIKVQGCQHRMALTAFFVRLAGCIECLLCQAYRRPLHYHAANVGPDAIHMGVDDDLGVHKWLLLGHTKCYLKNGEGDVVAVQVRGRTATTSMQTCLLSSFECTTISLSRYPQLLGRHKMSPPYNFEVHSNSCLHSNSCSASKAMTITP